TTAATPAPTNTPETVVVSPGQAAQIAPLMGVPVESIVGQPAGAVLGAAMAGGVGPQVEQILAAPAEETEGVLGVQARRGFENVVAMAMPATGEPAFGLFGAG